MGKSDDKKLKNLDGLGNRPTGKRANGQTGKLVNRQMGERPGGTT
jgi:hypothetical protein